MSKYIYPDKSNEISGMGGGYEEACRNMVIAGMEWIDEHPNCDLSFKNFKHIYGITTDESPDMKILQTHINAAIGNEATGAMMQACSNHILVAHKLGWERYIEKLNNDDEK